jgi:ATP-dependent DNA helicase RecQ
MTLDPHDLLSTFGLETFRDGQLEVIEALLNDARALAVFPTGGGKSLCYQLTALMIDGLTLVVSPLIALMRDQVTMLNALGIAAARLDSSLSKHELETVNKGVRDGTLKLLYVAPERFNNERFVQMLRGNRIGLFAIDEAHCISEWGHNFRPDYLKLAAFAGDVKAERILALTATATPPVVADICRTFEIKLKNAVVTGFRRPNLRIRSSPTTLSRRDAALAASLRDHPGTAIVYVTLQADAERVAEALNRAGLEARAYHAGLEDDVRSEVQTWWMTDENAVVVATIAFGMGIDKSNVRRVVHYHLPKSLEGYSQEIGRAGRDGLPAHAVMLGSAEDISALENFSYGDTPTDTAVRGVLREVLGLEGAFLLNLYDLGQRHDLRPTVLRTLLTYLELEGVLRQGTPCYATYQIQPLEELAGILGRFQGERSQFLRDIFAQAKRGRTWFTLDPDAAALALEQPRSRIMAAIQYLEDQGWVTIRASDVRAQFERTDQPVDEAALEALLIERFSRRENNDLERLEQVVALFRNTECRTAALARHFEGRDGPPCGQCDACLGNSKPFLDATEPRIKFPDSSALESLALEHPQALGHPRQRARFLCGLSSPAQTKAKLTRHALFGSLEGMPFLRVLEWCEEAG